MAWPSYLLLLLATMLPDGSGRPVGVPTLPTPPVLDVSQYPNCKRDWLAGGLDKTSRMLLIQNCVNELEAFNQFYLVDFTRRVKEYSRRLNIIEANCRHQCPSEGIKQMIRRAVVERLNSYRSIDASGSYGDGYRLYYVFVDKYKHDSRWLKASWSEFNS